MLRSGCNVTESRQEAFDSTLDPILQIVKAAAVAPPKTPDMDGQRIPTAAVARKSLLPAYSRACPGFRIGATWFTLTLLCFSFIGSTHAAADVSAWGNFRGMRIDGTLMQFDTELVVVERDWVGIARTGKGRQRPVFRRDGTRHVVTTQVGSILFRQTVADLDESTARLDLSAEAASDTADEGAFLMFRLPMPESAENPFMFQGRDGRMVTFQDDQAGSRGEAVSRATFNGGRFHLTISFARPAEVLLRRQEGGAQLFVRLLEANARAGKAVPTSITIAINGQPDKADVTYTLDSRREGRAFSGIGGNFRLQSGADQRVVRYLLDNLPVAWARAELPLAYWQPDEYTDPAEAVRQNGLHPTVRSAMELTANLGSRSRVLVLSIWSAPQWAIIGESRRGPKVNGVYGNTWNRDKAEQLYASIASYLLYLKEHFGTDVDMVSLNEPDIGVNVHLPPADHAAMIRELGAHLAKNGLRTRLLLGDTSDAAAWRYIEPALGDPATRPFVGALSFHSWQGLEDGNLRRWRDAAAATDLPLIVAEAGIDSSAWQYPAVFLEPGYAGDEVAAYLRIISTAQPNSLMQWQFTADYPLVRQARAANGTPGEVLEPTQRFWNLKQLSETSAGLRTLPLEGYGSDITAAALGDLRQGRYAIHLANNGATRKLRLDGLPSAVRSLQVYVTDAKRGMSREATVPVREGRVEIVLEREAYTTLLSVD